MWPASTAPLKICVVRRRADAIRGRARILVTLRSQALKCKRCPSVIRAALSLRLQTALQMTRTHRTARRACAADTTCCPVRSTPTSAPVNKPSGAGRALCHQDHEDSGDETSTELSKPQPVSTPGVMNERRWCRP